MTGDAREPSAPPGGAHAGERAPEAASGLDGAEVPAARPSTPSTRSRRTVAGRLLASYVLVLAAFALTMGWSFSALREAARDAELLRAGYAPVLLLIGEALAEQNVFSAQLNHITAAKNPGDVREWLETARRTRPRTFAHVREAAERGFHDDAGPRIKAFRDEITGEVASIERALATDPERFAQLFQALAAGDRDAAERAQNELVKREAESAQRLRAMKGRVEDEMEVLTRYAERREQRSIELLVGLSLLTLGVGAVISLYARRVLGPLTVVTERAKAVARGDLTPRKVIATNDEIGELATTFEGMVAAIQRARAELVQAERLATIGKMAAHITHEIRNPLSSIGLNVELLEEELVTPGAEREASQLLSAIKGEVDRLSRISEQYLSVARRPEPRLVVDRLDDLVRELVAFMRLELERADVRFRVDIAPDLPDVSFDETQLRQALLNLIRNAREAMPKGGELVIQARRAIGGGVDLTVDDTGEGIPVEARAAIFDPFFTTKARGTGLGLAVTREIIQTHRGVITCEEREGGGTRFHVYLPEANDAEGARGALSAPP